MYRFPLRQTGKENQRHCFYVETLSIEGISSNLSLLLIFQKPEVFLNNLFNLFHPDFETFAKYLFIKLLMLVDTHMDE